MYSLTDQHQTLIGTYATRNDAHESASYRGITRYTITNENTGFSAWYNTAHAPGTGGAATRLVGELSLRQQLEP